MVPAIIKKTVHKFLRSRGYTLQKTNNPAFAFQNTHYLRHNARRLEHLASLRIDVYGSQTLEVGAGIGDHSSYYLDRNCPITITEARQENLSFLKSRYPDTPIEFLDMENPVDMKGKPFEVIHCYGLLYHLGYPKLALKYMSEHCSKILFLETSVSFGSELSENIVNEDASSKTQAFSGKGCRPTRDWLFSELKSHFEYVYCPSTQPNHEEFPLDWTCPEKHKNHLSRAIFVASRQKLDNELLLTELPEKQTRH
ncbi:MAG: class I SAM-dependent methyltransferase [Fibrobacteria bacterium]|nr:class I SAM-dependent methyltransferase [Fibrobacteria bacterium]